jgi:hypothetical protein
MELIKHIPKAMVEILKAEQKRHESGDPCEDRPSTGLMVNQG